MAATAGMMDEELTVTILTKGVSRTRRWRRQLIGVSNQQVDNPITRSQKERTL
jgi:hypothetical protein